MQEIFLILYFVQAPKYKHIYRKKIALFSCGDAALHLLQARPSKGRRLQQKNHSIKKRVHEISYFSICSNLSK
jgi:hypothetical protein